MRFLASWLVLLAGLSVAHADGAFKVGIATRDFIPAEPYDWRGVQTHALHATIWYPAAADAREVPQWIGPRIVPFADAGVAAPDAAPAPGSKRPLILLSHGAGGMADGLGWLGAALAAHGFVAVAVNHPGNNAVEQSTPEGFSLWWLRAADLGAVIDAVLADRLFGGLIDPARIGAAGHSAGGYTVIEIAGGISDPARLQAFCGSPKADASCSPSQDVVEMRQKSEARLASDPEFRLRYGKAGESYREKRVRAVFAMAPGLVPMFTPESLDNISIPVAIASGDADEVVSSSANAEMLAKAIPHATLKLFPRAGHFVFFDSCTAIGRLVLRTNCRDADDVDRDAIHADTIRLALDFFAANLH